MHRYFLLLACTALAACNAGYQDHTPTADEDSEVLINLMQPTSPDSIINIKWPPVDNHNPFASEPLRYEVWKNDQLVDTVKENSYQLDLSELQTTVGCISIRAVRGAQKSDYSSPSCYVVTL